MIYLSETCKVNWFTYIKRKLGAGYSIYPMMKWLSFDDVVVRGQWVEVIASIFKKGE